MGLNCAVLVKQVPDTKRITGKAMNDDGTVNRSALPAIFNPEDHYALEAALEVRDRMGGTVTVICMGPPPACQVLRESLFTGADRVVLITDRRAAASDTLATSYILACAVRKLAQDLGRVDMVFCGRQAIDGDTAQTGPQCAEKLGLPQVTYLEEIVELAEDHLVARRNVGNGYEVVRAPLPCLVTVTDTFREPRPFGAQGLMKFARARARLEVEREVLAANPNADEKTRAGEVERRAADLRRRGLLIEQWTLDDVKADLAWCGRDGSPTKVKRIQSVVLKGTGHQAFQNTDEDVSRLVHLLIEEHTIG